MKVILLQNVPRIGQKGDIKEVKDGFVRNMLLPKGLAKIATPAEIKKLKDQENAKNQESQERQQKILELFKQISNQRVEIKEKVNEKGHLFAQINVDKIISAVKEQFGIVLETNYIKLDKGIKEAGEHTITLSDGDRESNFVLNIIPISGE